MSKLVAFTERPHPATVGKRRLFQRVWDTLRIWLGNALNRAGVPGMVKETIIPDEVTGAIVRIKTNPLYTVVSIDGRDYYFHRFTGRFGGTGMGCR
jgi:hypothetical protein